MITIMNVFVLTLTAEQRLDIQQQPACRRRWREAGRGNTHQGAVAWEHRGDAVHPARSEWGIHWATSWRWSAQRWCWGLAHRWVTFCFYFCFVSFSSPRVRDKEQKFKPQWAFSDPQQNRFHCRCVYWDSTASSDHVLVSVCWEMVLGSCPQVSQLVLLLCRMYSISIQFNCNSISIQLWFNFFWFFLF